MRRIDIGDIRLGSPFVLAPLAGITDVPERLLAQEQGASLCYTEMISVKGIIYGDRKTKNLMAIDEKEGPVGIQLFGREPDEFKKAIELCRDAGNCLWDINMGCPVPKVVKNGEGSALLKEPDLAGRIIEAAVSSTDKPVTAKIRIGWDEDSINAVEVAKTLEYAGASAIAVHGRTRSQMYQGKADRDMIARVKEAVSIPVIANGDVFDAYDAMEMLEYTNADMVMIARGALGNPWIFRDCIALYQGKEIPEKASPEMIRDTMIKHLIGLKELKGENRAVAEMRKHIGWYVKGLRGAASFRRKVNGISDFDQLVDCIKEIMI